MKQKNRICIYPLIVMGFILMLVTGCENDESLPDYAGKIAGTYNGTFTVIGTGTAPCSSTLTKSSEKVVDLEFEMYSTPMHLHGIEVSSPESDIYALKYTDASGILAGKVEGNNLTWTLTVDGVDATFNGTK